MESLLGQPGGAPEETREDHPDGSWRADSLGKSRHARLSDHIQEPLGDSSVERAREVCAQACRDLLLDYAPVVVLLPAADRARFQAIVTYGRLLFDFARQTAVEGERLAALNRLEFTLDEALSGGTASQPVFVQLAAEERRRPFERQGFDDLTSLARERVLEPRPRTVEGKGARAEKLATAFHELQLGAEPADSLIRLGALAIRIHELSTLGESMRRGFAGLPMSELPAAGDPSRPVGRDTVQAAVRAEIERLQRMSQETRDASREAAPGYRAATRYSAAVSGRLLVQLDRLGWHLVSEPPRLGVGARLGSLFKARIGL